MTLADELYQTALQMNRAAAEEYAVPPINAAEIATAMREVTETMRLATVRLARHNEVFALLRDWAEDRADCDDGVPNDALRILGWIEYAEGIRPAP